MQETAAGRTRATDFETATYRKVTRHLIPFLFGCYILAYVDRVNVGFAKLQMQQDLGMSETVYGIGAGIFFLGYFLFEIPSNLILQRIGARFWLGPIIVAWGIVSACTVFVRSSGEFYALRFLLGIMESGFFPGVILYLTYWYTRKQRARMVAIFVSANPLSGVFAGPISGAILKHMTGVGGLRAWQWLFLLEGIPSVIAGLITMWYLVSKPRDAVWLSAEEKALVERRLHEEEEAKKSEGHARKLFDAFRSGRLWLLAIVYFGFQMGNYGLWFWLPQTLKDTITQDPALIGLLSAIPWASAALSMVFYAHHSDVTGERRWHIAAGAGLSALAFGLSAVSGLSGGVGLVLSALAAIGIMCGQTVYWALPTGMLSGAAAAAGIAWISSLGGLAGYVSPYIIGRVRDATGNMGIGQLVLSASCLASALCVLLVSRRSRG
jgi:sugar phosphate permease